MVRDQLHWKLFLLQEEIIKKIVSENTQSPVCPMFSETACTVDCKVFLRIQECSEPKHTDCVQSHLDGNSYTHEDTNTDLYTQFTEIKLHRNI